MGKKIVWSPTSLLQLEEIHTTILEASKSLQSADRVVNDIMGSVAILSSQPEIYKLDGNKLNNDATYRSFEIRTYKVSYRVLPDTVRIIRVRYSKQEPRKY